ncbi:MULTISPECIES: hypothetical protein [Aequorivita]|uniref:Lipoprotein n=1 Tax=Aequorivita iocasae TaxID=2803865 RepID=A0ABX7DU55_9FLAO|nr:MULTISPECIES: hypothetical protein [Aequorivita]QQX77161.1 hypothetical protein JK629_02495 [Aequorivita iocasae]UCA56648.1 hypothetical protein LDL78_02515 [Aequorivita sp. F7]
MKLKKIAILLLLTAIIVSCKNKKEESKETETPITETTTPETVMRDTVAIIENLQGKWKEAEYPYRTAEFKGAEVKFVEEGVVEPPKFEAYQIATTCPARQESANKIAPELVYFYLPENKLCQKISVADGKLTLSGTTQDYRIVYERVKE